MKNTPLLILLLFFSFLGTQDVNAQCDSNNDIINNNGTDGVNQAYSVGQHITATCTGEIGEISFFTSTVIGSRNVQIVVYNGKLTTSNTPSILGTRTINISASTTLTKHDFSFSTPLNVVQGQMYSVFINTATSNTRIVADIENSYPAGTAFVFGAGIVTDFPAADLRFIVSYNDTRPPNARCKNVTVELDENGEVSITPDDVDNNSNGGVTTIAVFPDDFDCSHVGDQTVTLTVGDSSNNFDTCEATVTIVDNLAPVITGCQDIVVNVDSGQCSAVVNYADIITISDNCTIANIEITGLPSESAFPVGDSQIDYVVTDSSGNVSTCSFTITVEDNERPTITPCQDIIVNLGPGECDAVVFYMDQIDVSDNCSINTFDILVGPPNGSTFPIGDTFIEIQAADPYGNARTCNFNVRVVSYGPVLTCPVNVEISCGIEEEIISNSNETDVTIIDGSLEFVSSTINVDASGIAELSKLSTISVELELDSTYAGDLIAELESPTGEVIRLFNRPGFGGIGTNSNLDSNFPITITDAASVTAELMGDANVNNGNTDHVICQDDGVCNLKPDNGNEVGDESFDEFVQTLPADHSAMDGDWTLRLSDRFQGDNAVLRGWTLNLHLDVLAPSSNIDTSPVFTGTATATDPCDPTNTITVTHLDEEVLDCPGFLFIRRTWTATDENGLTNTCLQEIHVRDQTAPFVTSCPEDIEVILTEGDVNSTAVVTYDAITGEDGCSAFTITRTEGLPSGADFPFGSTTVTHELTDGCGNTSTCTFTVNVQIIETEVTLDSEGRLYIKDINGDFDTENSGDSNDDITVSNDGVILTISGLVAPVLVSDGVTLTTDTSVTIPMNSITNGFLFFGSRGVNKITIANDLSLSGPSNLMVLSEIDELIQNGALAIEADLYIEGTDTSTIILGEITANSLLYQGFNIEDTDGKINLIDGASIRITGDLNINNGLQNESDHFFGGDLDIEAATVTNFTAGSDLSLSVVTTATSGVNNIETSPGVITLLNITTAGDSELNVKSTSNITQLAGTSITTDHLILGGDGANTAVLNEANNINALSAININDPSQSAFASVSFTNSTNLFLENILLDEFTFNAPEFDFEPDRTNITKFGSGESSFNGNIDLNSGTGTAFINHNAGTINFNGQTNDLLNQLTYNGLEGTVTNFNGGVTTIPSLGANTALTFGHLNGTGTIFIGDIPISILNTATFSGANTLVQGVGAISGSPALFDLGATITPGVSNDTATLNFLNDLIIASATFAPLIQSDTSYDSLSVQGTVTLSGADLSPLGGFIGQQDDEEIILIENDGNDAVVGTFNNLPEGAEITFGNYSGLISYIGGDGNDVSLLPPPETIVELNNGKLTITDANGGTSDDAITLSNNGTVLTISDLIGVVEVIGGPLLTNSTTVTVDLTAITNGIEFLGADGDNAITFANDLTLSGATNDITINNISTYTQSGFITTDGAFTINGNADADIALGTLTATGLSIVGVNSISDLPSDYPIEITGVTTLQSVGTITLNTTTNHHFLGLVHMEASRISFVSKGSNTVFGNITTTDPTLGVNTLQIRSGTMSFSGDVLTAGISQLHIFSFSKIEQESGSINTDVLTLQGRGNGSTSAYLTAGTNDIRVLETFENNPMSTVSFTDINDFEIESFNIAQCTLTGNSIILTENTHITKRGSGVSSFNGDINSDSIDIGIIDQEAGTIIFDGDNNFFGIQYNGAVGTVTQFIGEEVRTNNSILTFGTLESETVFITDGNEITILDSSVFTSNNGELAGFGILNGPVNITNDGSINPGESFAGVITTENLNISSGNFEAQVDGATTDVYDQIIVNGTVTLNNASLLLTGGFAGQIDDEIVLIDNDDNDAVVGTFNNLPEDAAITFGNYSGFISYIGGDGNDVTLVTDPDNIIPILISEYQPELDDESQTNQTIELIGVAGENFTGALVVIEGDRDSGEEGLVLSSDNVTGTFDANGLLTVSVPNLIGPSHTLVLTSFFTGTVGVTDIDESDDGTVDNTVDFGNIFDAVSVFDEALDVSHAYGSDLGGTDMPNIDDRPRLVFREASTGDFFTVGPDDTVYDLSGTSVHSFIFDNDPTTTTFDVINPSTTTIEDTFITKWETTLVNENITIPFSGANSLAIDWGDNTPIETGLGDNPSHSYATVGEYIVTVYGNVGSIGLGNHSNRLNILEVQQWGNTQWTTMASAFQGCKNLVITATDAPNLSNVSDMSFMLRDAGNIDNISQWQDISHWDVSNVQDMSSLFRDSKFNQDISAWNVDNVTDMKRLFQSNNMFNQDISSWNVSGVTNMFSMFYRANVFDKDIASWDVSKVTNMNWMFNSAHSFDRDLGAWDISSLQQAQNMFGNMTLSTQNYDNILIGWSTLDTAAGEIQIPTGVTFSGGNSLYCFSESERNSLLITYGWTISDNGLDPLCDTCLDTTTFIGGAWDNGAPNSSTHAIIAENYTTSIENIEACSLTVNTGVTLTVSAGEYIEIQGDITVNGSLIVEHTANVVQINDDAVVTNNGSINVNVTTPILKPRDFMVISSPMTAETRVGVFTDAFRVLNHSTSNFVPHPDVTAQFPMAENFADDNGNDWTNYNGLINPAEGYLVYPQPDISSGNTSYDLTYNLGTLNNGVVSYNVEFNTDKNASPNVIGNPYASAISATDFINANAMVDEVFFWEHITTPNNTFPGYNSANFSMEDISMRNLTGGVAAASDPGTTTQPNDFISSGQGFGIKATAAGTAAFNNSMRRTSGNNTLRLSGDTDRIWLKLSNQQYEMQGSTLIGFSESTSQQLDQGYDSRRLASIVSLYSHLENGSQELGIQSREAFESSIEIPMGFSTMIDSELYYNISITDVQGINIETATVYLIDNELQVTTNLSKQDYEFTSVKGTFNNRFTLKFEKDIVLDTADNVLFQDSISIYPNPAADYITIGNPNQLELVNAAIYDLTGRLIQQIDLSDISSSKTIDISNLNTATYIIAIKGIKGKVVKRILKQ